jgi:hypothetical protein
MPKTLALDIQRDHLPSNTLLSILHRSRERRALLLNHLSLLLPTLSILHDLERQTRSIQNIAAGTVDAAEIHHDRIRLFAMLFLHLTRQRAEIQGGLGDRGLKAAHVMHRLRPFDTDTNAQTLGHGADLLKNSAIGLDTLRAPAQATVPTKDAEFNLFPSL